VVLIKCEREGYVRFLKPACSITLQDIYIQREEVKKTERVHFRKFQSVLLTEEYDSEEVKSLVLKSLDFGIALCVRIDAISPNNITTALDVRLTPGQLRLIWQEKPKPVLIRLDLPDNQSIQSYVGINGLLVDKVQADCYFELIKTNKLESQASENILLEEQSTQGDAISMHPHVRQSNAKYREDAISDAVIKSILPELLPDKSSRLSAKKINQLKSKCFEKLKESLEKDGAKFVIYKKMNKNDDSFIQGKDKDETAIHTTYCAFRKRFSGLLNSYLD